MKIWVDDVREPPDDTWAWFKTVAETLNFFHPLWFIDGNREIEVLSLDHDLGGDETTREIVLYMCYNNFWPVEVRCHSQNPVGREWLEGMIEKYKNGN